MSYRLFYTDYEISQADYVANKFRFMPMVYSDIDDALRRARQIIENGGVPWEIERPDDTALTRYEIVETLRRRRTDLGGPPKFY